MSAVYQPRWIAYCQATGVTPCDRPPGGNAGYIAWINRAWAVWDAGPRPEWARRLGTARVAEEHDAFTAWLCGAVAAGEMQVAA